MLIFSLDFTDYIRVDICSISLGRERVTCWGLTANVSRLLVNMNNAWSLITPAARPSSPGKNNTPAQHISTIWQCAFVQDAMLIDAEPTNFGLVTSECTRWRFLPNLEKFMSIELDWFPPLLLHDIFIPGSVPSRLSHLSVCRGYLYLLVILFQLVQLLPSSSPAWCLLSFTSRACVQARADPCSSGRLQVILRLVAGPSVHLGQRWPQNCEARLVSVMCLLCPCLMRKGRNHNQVRVSVCAWGGGVDLFRELAFKTHRQPHTSHLPSICATRWDPPVKLNSYQIIIIHACIDPVT